MATTLNRFHTSLFLFLGMFFWGTTVFVAQENPPIPVKVEVRTAKFLNFGAFTTGATGGTVTVDDFGQRTSTGDIYELYLGDSPSPAIFDLTANPGTMINIVVPPLIPLYLEGGSVGASGLVQLEINKFSTGEVFITTALPPATNEIMVGGTLHVSPGAPAGKYSGIFTLTFNHE